MDERLVGAGHRLVEHKTPPFDGSFGGTLSAYIDGQLSGSQTISASLNTTLSTQGLMIGSDPTDPNMTGDLFKGSMDELAIYPTALTLAEATRHYSAGRGRQARLSSR